MGEYMGQIKNIKLHIVTDIKKMLSQKKKKFSYSAVVKKPFVPPSRVAKNNVDFPDDFKSFSQSSKKQKIEEEKVGTNLPTVCNGKAVGQGSVDLMPQDDLMNVLMDDDFDFSEAANEIDQIEIAASQMYVKKVPKEEKENLDFGGDILDELLSGTSNSGTMS